MNDSTVFELFAGAGGMAVGLHRSGESHRIMLERREWEIVLRHEDVDRRSQ